MAKLNGGYSLNTRLVFHSWFKDIQMYFFECNLSQQEAIMLVKDNTSEHVQLKVEYYLGMTPKSQQSFQGLIEHLSLAFQSCETDSSLIGDFYNWLQKVRQIKEAFADELQILGRKIVAHKLEFLGEAYQGLKHQYIHNLKGPYF